MGPKLTAEGREEDPLLPRNGGAGIVDTQGPDAFCREAFQRNIGLLTEVEQVGAFAVGLAPKATQFRSMDLAAVKPGAGTRPSLSLACHLCSGRVATETLAILLSRRPPRCAPHDVQFDPHVRVYKQGYLWLGNRNPIQRLKRRWLLRKLCALATGVRAGIAPRSAHAPARRRAEAG